MDFSGNQMPTNVSPDITAAQGRYNAPVRPVYKISENYCERAIFIWELHEGRYPLPLISPKFIVDPQDPDRDSSTSVIDLMKRIPSGVFIRGQEINKPAEWQLCLQNSPGLKVDNETELQVVLKCEKIYIQASTHILTKIALEIIDEEGVAEWSSGDVYESEIKPIFQGNSHVMSLGKRADLQDRRSELIKNGILRFRLRLNIYKDLTVAGSESGKPDQNEKPQAKRRRLESGVSSGLTGLLGSLESLWNNRQQSGDITILCGGQEIKAHRFILSGRSKVFMEMLDSRMNTTEKSTCLVKVDDIVPDIVTAMLEFLYLSDTSRFDWGNIDHVCAMIYAADKYWLTPLSARCYQTLMKAMNLENFAKIAKVAFMYNCGKQFKDEVRHFFESNQVTLNDVKSFRNFAHEDFDYFYKLFFHIS